MLRIIRSATLRALQERVEEAGQGRAEAEAAAARYTAEAETWHEKYEKEARRADEAEDAVHRAAQRTEELIELRAELSRVSADVARDEGELAALRAQILLDTEDRAVLRMLLRAARRQSRPADRVYVLWRRGRLHSLHATVESAEIAAEAEGAPRSGWTADEPGASMAPAEEVAWRVQGLRLGGVG